MEFELLGLIGPLGLIWPLGLIGLFGLLNTVESLVLLYWALKKTIAGLSICGFRLKQISVFVLPMSKVGYDGFHVCSDLFCWPVLRCHMLYAVVYQLLLAGISELPILVAPFAVLFVEVAVWVFAYR